MFHENESPNESPNDDAPSDRSHNDAPSDAPSDARQNEPANVNRPAEVSTKAATPDRIHRCSYCGESFKRSESKNMPFCSPRCQQVDLGMWLNETYGLPHEGEGAPDYDPEADL